MIHASQTTPGQYYRATRRPPVGVFYTAPRQTKRNTPREWVGRQLSKGAPLANYWAWFLKSHPDCVLMIQTHRGMDTFTGKRWEIRTRILVAPDKRLRQVKTRPGNRG